MTLEEIKLFVHLDETSPTWLTWNDSFPFLYYSSYRIYRSTESKFAGKTAGSVKSSGEHSQILILGKKFLTHRIVYMLHNNVQLTDDQMIDHKDLNPQNNNPSNLRIATYSQNIANCRARVNNQTGHKGVMYHRYPDGRIKYRASITINKKPIHLGIFDSPIEAHKAYRKAAKKTYKQFARAK